MYHKIKRTPSKLKVNQGYIGETIEQKVDRIVNNKEAIKDGAPLIYTDREEGVIAEFDPRADRWEEALGQFDQLHKTHVAKRMERIEGRKKEAEAKDGKTESAPATPSTAESKS